MYMNKKIKSEVKNNLAIFENPVFAPSLKNTKIEENELMEKEELRNIILNQELKIKEQESIIKELKDNSKWSKIIDNYVDNWYEKNKDEVDIGRVELFNLFGWKPEIDLMPDELEKHMYKKMMKIMFSFITSPNQ